MIAKMRKEFQKNDISRACEICAVVIFRVSQVKTQVQRLRISNEKFSRIPRTFCIAAASQKRHIAGGLAAKEIRIGKRYIVVDSKRIARCHTGCRINGLPTGCNDRSAPREISRGTPGAVSRFDSRRASSRYTPRDRANAVPRACTYKSTLARKI